ncbi:outer membrane protein [Bradyrhizobium sp. SEMIA]|uniref:outer membrane protein n=1 Tax=Bradyrhizobium sp. SEMIA TaxID=2597515 RepID=UPI0018A3F840|nr:outer membrane beta-barrel protein [Bradyrhizobium sp. SEMIA]QOG23301.1 outer membrane beta-barrel protein [Bradyrhizobium sp. SEMIA]
MKKLCFGLVAALAVASAPALAADMAAKAPIYKAPVPVPFVWTGCYVGSNVGGGWAHTGYRVDDPTQGAFNGSSLGSNNGSGVVGGGQVGCDYQTGNWVFGAQAMFDAADIKGSHLDPINAFPLVWTSKISWLATATGRVGYTVAPQALLYLKGGAAWVRTHDDRTGPALGIILSYTTPDRSDFGWTVGAGFEYLLTRNWSVFAEYNYIDVGAHRASYTRNTDGASFFVDASRQVHMATVGVNFRFGQP